MNSNQEVKWDASISEIGELIITVLEVLNIVKMFCWIWADFPVVNKKGVQQINVTFCSSGTGKQLDRRNGLLTVLYIENK